MRFGFNWQIPFRTAVPGYHEWMLKYIHQMTFMAANIQELISAQESLIRRDFGVVKGILLNQHPLLENPIPRMKNWGLPAMTVTAATSLSGTLGATNILPGFLFIRANYPDGSDKILFDDGNGNFIFYHRVVGSIDYAAGTYTIDAALFDTSNATDFQISFCPGTIAYAAQVDGVSGSTVFTVTGATINAGGTGYTAGDVVTVPGATINVTTVDASGVATAVTIADAPVSSTDNAGTAVAATGGTGTGLTLNVVTTSSVSPGLWRVAGAIPGTAASTPGVSIYFTETTHKIYVGYTTNDLTTLQEIYDFLKRY